MNRSITVTLSFAVLLLAASGDVRAQSLLSDKLTISANVGFQAQSQDVATTTTYSIYGEDATLSTTQSVGNGPIYDVGAEYKLTKSLGVGLSWSWFSDKFPIAVTAQVPDPLVSGQLRVASAQANNAKHTESVFNLALVYRWPFTDKIDLVFSGGPTIADIHQDMVTGITVAPETGPPFPDPTITDVTVATKKKTGFGVNIGADAQYMFTPRYGAGVGLRYVYASADFPDASDKIKAGGFQVLGGLRVRF